MTCSHCRTLAPPFALSLLMLTGCVGLRLGPDPASPEGQAQWVQRTLEGMSLRDQVASLVVVAVTAEYAHASDPSRTWIDHLVSERGIGGIAMWGGDPYSETLVIDRLQGIAPVPLLVATDNEWGLAMRVGGSSRFPMAMALGAADDETLAFEAGRITGRETRAVGIHMGYGPVADVNNNPDNPIINIRSFGEDPQLVARLAGAWARGASSEGMITTAKHFPGHGDVSVDSHMDLPTVGWGIERLEAVELIPFRSLIEEGVDAVMVAHLWIPALDPDETVPATLSHNVITGLLREGMGFEGLVVTDALRMGALVRYYGADEVAVRAVEAGVDLLLLPTDAEGAIEAVTAAVESGRLDPERVREAALRMLRTKARLGLHIDARITVEEVEQVVGGPEGDQLARVIARRAVTVVRNEKGLLPLASGQGSAPPDSGRWGAHTPPMATGPFASVDTSVTDGRGVLFLGLSSDPGSGGIGDSFFRRLMPVFPDADRMDLYPDYGSAEALGVTAAVENASLVVAAVFSRVRDQKGHAAVVEPHAALLRYASALGKRVVVVAFGPPYFLRQFPDVDSYVAVYDYTDLSQQAAAEVLRGEVGARGRLPVSIPGLYPVGWGINVGPSPQR